MADRDISVMNATFKPDNSGDIYPAPLDVLLTMTNAKDSIAYFMAFPTGADITFATNFLVPAEYVDTPRIVIQGVLSGTPANVLAFTMQQNETGPSDTVDAAYEAEDLANNSVWTGFADEDFYEEIITLTPGSAYTPGQRIWLNGGRDDSVDDTTFDFLLVDVIFRFADA